MNTATAVRTPALKTTQGRDIPLQALDIRGHLEDALARVELTQTYRNLEEINVEAVYTFPLPVEAVLLELTVTLAGRTLVGSVTTKQQAETQYENALAAGDTAVMLEQVEPGLYTMNLGNLLAGEKADIRLRYALPLRWEGEHLRLSLPTTLAPRYGDSARAGVQPHQQPIVDALAEYPYRLSLRIAGKLALAMLSSSTHRIVSERDDRGLQIRIADEAAFADRDFVLSVQASGAVQSSYIVAADGEQHVAHAVFRIPEHDANQPIRLKVLVDCSGSMAGDSMAIAKALAMTALDRLGSSDSFSLTAFGSEFKHHQQGRVCEAASGAALVDARSFVGGLDADLGGTEMLSALQAVFQLGRGRGKSQGADVLLITDGETWDRDAIVKAARESGHRIFVIGVGASPSEILARGIAEATGGFASFVAPKEDVAPVIARHLARMRLPRVEEARLHLPGAKQLWQCPARLEAATFAGDTLHVFAGLDGARRSGDAHLDIRYADGSMVTVKAQAEVGADAEAQADLPRIGAAQRLWWAGAGLVETGEQELTDLAVRYQLMSRYTNYILVHERGERAAQDLPELRQVPAMLAAGWGGTGSVSAPAKAKRSLSVQADLACAPTPAAAPAEGPLFRNESRKRAGAASKILPPPGAFKECEEVSSQLIDGVPFEGSLVDAVSPRELVERLNPAFGLFNAEKSVPRRVSDLEAMGVADDVIRGLRELVAQGHAEDDVVLAFWKGLLGVDALGFSRAHRRGILAAHRSAAPAAALEPLIAAALEGTAAEHWRWVLPSAMPAAPQTAAAP